MFKLGFLLNIFLSGGADFLRSIGKIYVVVAVILIIFAGIVAFLFILENRLSKLEKEVSNEKT